jgi:hypothetical protein
VAAQLPLSSIDDGIAVTKRLLSLQKGPFVLVGPSYGGIVISGAANGVPKSKLSSTLPRYDQMIPPQAEEFMVKRMDATARKVPSSYAAMAHPNEVADLITQAAESTQAAVATT